MVVVFVALVFITMLIAGIFMMSNIVEVYQDDFVNQQESVANGDFTVSLRNAFSSKGTTEEQIAKASNTISLYAGKMGLSSESFVSTAAAAVSGRHSRGRARSVRQAATEKPEKS